VGKAEVARVFLSLGSNVDRERNIASAVCILRERFGQLRLSSLYESDAVGFKGDPFYNVVVELSSSLSPADLVTVFREIEKASQRSRYGPRFGPRTLDLDLLLYDDLILDKEGLKLPRREIMECAFVLCPLAEVAGELRHPVNAKTYAALWAEFDARGQRIRRAPLSVDELIERVKGGPARPERAAGNSARSCPDV
jgi:2-amino-4-hydroxy-6-hydroxymethyldihydropteridine diphosphokinase